MSGWVLLAATAAAVAAALVVPRRVRLPDETSGVLRAPGPRGVVLGSDVPGSGERALLVRLRPVLVPAAAGGAWAMVGGTLALPAALVAAIVAWTVLGRAEDPATVRRREALVRDLPVGVDLLASCLEAGAPPGRSLQTVASALGGPVGEEFTAIHHRLVIGMAPAEVWRAVSRDPQLAPLGRALARAHETGASVSAAVHRLALELRESARADVEARARSIEVRAAAPLGLCLLPAFMLLGVVPMVVGVFTSMELLG